jgi:hypothetical protein
VGEIKEYLSAEEDAEDAYDEEERRRRRESGV